MRALAVAALALLLLAAQGTTTSEETLEFWPFGHVRLYRGAPEPARVVVLVSGADGWDGAATATAHGLASLDALVIGIDLARYLANAALAPGDELFPSADLEQLSQFVQRKLARRAYVPPVLVGAGAGAALVYATLVQAHPNTFRGALSLGFCPEIALPRPLGRGEGLEARRSGVAPERYTLVPARAPSASWIVLESPGPHACDPALARDFVRRVAGGEVVAIPELDGDPTVPAAWRAALRAALDRVAARPAAGRAAEGDELRDLPLVEVAATAPATGTLAVILSGDGGWASVDRQIGGALADAGIAVVGLDSLRYFWTRRTPDGAADDLARVLRHYRAAWHAPRLLLVGYSRGADVLPFMVSRLPDDLRAAVALVALLGPGRSVDFEFHLSDWLGGPAPAGARPTLPEVERLRGTRILCVYGDAETESLCPALDAGLATRLELAGGHHFGGDYERIARAIIAMAR